MPKETGKIGLLSTELKVFDRETYRHSKRVASLMSLFGSYLGTEHNELVDYKKIGLLHDIGKIRIPIEILTKPGKFEDFEMDIMRRHPAYSENIISEIPDNLFKNKRMALDAVLYHHEDWNGKGYPFGLIGDKIPEAARILRIVDSYDAIKNRRYYKEPNTHEETMNKMNNFSGKQFDPNLLTQFNEFMRKPQAA